MNIQSIRVKGSLFLVIALTITVSANLEGAIIKSYSASQYKDISSNLKLGSVISETALTTSCWRLLDSGTGGYSFSGLAKTLQGPHIHIVEDAPLIIKGVSEVKRNDEIKVKEIIVGLFKRDDDSMSVNVFFAVTTDGEILALHKYSGHKIITELTPLINKM